MTDVPFHQKSCDLCRVLDELEADDRWVCDLCGQPLAGPDDCCNSGIHQGPDDLNGFRGRAVREEIR